MHSNKIKYSISALILIVIVLITLNFLVKTDNKTMKLKEYIHHIPTQNGEDLKVLYIMATTQEYGNALKTIIKPYIVGVGPIESAINTTTILKDLNSANLDVDLVINIGSAGSKIFDYKSIFQVTSFTYRDMDASPIGFEKGVTPFSKFPKRLKIESRIPNLKETSISTGANFVTTNEYKALEDDAVDMEGYAVYRSCLAMKMPMIKIIGISDGKEETTGNKEDWTKYLKDIDKNIADVLISINNLLINGKLQKDHLIKLPKNQ